MELLAKLLRPLVDLYVYLHRGTNKSTNPGSIKSGSSSLLANVKIFDENPRRLCATITNNSATTCYIVFQDNITPTVGTEVGVRLNANGGSLVFGLATDIPYTGPVFISGGTTFTYNVTTTEM